jgi:hypothetical protein
VNGETARKKPPSAPRSRPWSLSAEIVTISLQDSPRLLRQSFGSRCRRRPRSRCSPPRVLLLQTRSWSCIPGRISPSDRAGVELRGGCSSRTPYWQYTISRRRRRVSTVSSSHDTAVPFLWGSLLHAPHLDEIVHSLRSPRQTGSSPWRRCGRRSAARRRRARSATADPLPGKPLSSLLLRHPGPPPRFL